MVLPFLLALLCALLPSGAGASGPDEDSPRDWATGSGAVIVSAATPDSAGDLVVFDASILPSENATGKIEYYDATLSDPVKVWSGKVTCLVVQDNAALIGGVITDSTDRFSIRIFDGPARDDLELDPIALRYGPGVAGDCTSMEFTDPTTVLLARGDVRVHDYQP